MLCFSWFLCLICIISLLKRHPECKLLLLKQMTANDQSCEWSNKNKIEIKIITGAYYTE